MLTQLGERLDSMEGFRGNPVMQSYIDMNGHKVTNAVKGTAAGDAVTKDQITPTLLDTPYSAGGSASFTQDITGEDFEEAALIWGYITLANPSSGEASFDAGAGAVAVKSDSATEMKVPFCIGLSGTTLTGSAGAAITITITGYM